MNPTETINLISGIIKEECALQGFIVKQLILFGSRARNDGNSDSDWDFLAIVDKPIEWKQKMSIWLPINRRLAKNNLDADVLFKTEADYERDKNDTGKVTYYAHKEGVAI